MLIRGTPNALAICSAGGPWPGGTITAAYLRTALGLVLGGGLGPLTQAEAEPQIRYRTLDQGKP